MKFLSANSSNNEVANFNKAVKKGDTVFVIFHSPSCGHCVETLPIWEEIESVLSDRYDQNDRVMVADIQDDVLNKTQYAKQIEGFPTMWCISNNGRKIEPIEQAKLLNPPRTIDGFVEWIEQNTPSSYSSSSNEKSAMTNKKKKYRTTPYPHSRNRHHRRARNLTKKGGRNKIVNRVSRKKY